MTAMKALPAALAPWALWLDLLAPDLAPAVGAMLLRLHGVVGKLSTATLERGAEPAGIGNIVRRGNYERLLMTEWLYADAVPDEFLRRAGSAELLFTGPEPAVHQGSLESVALFDTGPAQLGEPRLAHIALFILLARRAQQAGARFRWGIWRRPGDLHEDTGMAGLRKLLKARSVHAPPADAAERWQSALGGDLSDCWLVGVAGAAPRQARDRVAVRRALSGNHLDVSVQQKRDQRSLQLALPDTPIGLRLLRDPFVPVAPVGVFHHASSRASRAQAPRLSGGGQLLCVPQRGGGAIMYAVPQSLRAKPGKSRVIAAPAHGSILAVGVLQANGAFKGKLSCITTAGGTLGFYGFPGPLFSTGNLTCDRPPPQQFLAPPGMAHWLQAFFLRARDPGKQLEHVAVLDTKHQLVAWRAAPAKSHRKADATTLSFHPILDHVIGVQQRTGALCIARDDGDGVQFFVWDANEASPRKTYRIGRQGSQVFMGMFMPAHSGQFGDLLAINTAPRTWWVGSSVYHNQGAITEIDDDAVVLGVAVSGKHSDPGLVVLHKDRQRIELRSGGYRFLLADSPERIAHASMDAVSARLAWVTANTATVVVRAIADDAPLMQISRDQDSHEL